MEAGDIVIGDAGEKFTVTLYEGDTRPYGIWKPGAGRKKIRCLAQQVHDIERWKCAYKIRLDQFEKSFVVGKHGSVE
jgi:hypothetical protein